MKRFFICLDIHPMWTWHNSIPHLHRWFLSSSSLSPHLCNRGVGVLMTKSPLTVFCFCPSLPRGDRCQYHADPLSIVLDFDVSPFVDINRNDRRICRLLDPILFNDEVLMIDHPSNSISSSTTITERRRNWSVISFILVRQLFFTTDVEDSSIALWIYPLDFSHPPVSRLAEVLRFDRSAPHQSRCSSNRCPLSAQCHRQMNNRSEYICLCRRVLQGYESLYPSRTL